MWCCHVVGALSLSLSITISSDLYFLRSLTLVYWFLILCVCVCSLHLVFSDVIVVSTVCLIICFILNAWDKARRIIAHEYCQHLLVLCVCNYRWSDVVCHVHWQFSRQPILSVCYWKLFLNEGGNQQIFITTSVRVLFTCFVVVVVVVVPFGRWLFGPSIQVCMILFDVMFIVRLLGFEYIMLDILIRFAPLLQQKLGDNTTFIALLPHSHIS